MNAFQLRLIDQGSGDFDIEFRYEDVNWTTGNASGGSGGLGGTVARAGWTSGNGTDFYELSQAGDQAQMLDLENAINTNAGNVDNNEAGVFLWSVQGGSVGPATDTTAPTLQSADVNGTTLVLTYDEALDGGSDPAGTDFTVNVNGSPVTVSAVDADGSTVTLTLPTAVQPSDTVTVDYTAPASNPTQDTAGNDAASFSGQSVTNNTPDTTAPTLQSAEVNGTTLVLTYDEALDGGSDPAGTDFTVNVNGSPVTVSAVDADGSTVTLTLPTAVQPSDTVTVDYTTPASNPTQDTTGNDAASFSGQSVINNSSDTLAPVLQSATVNGTTLVLTYDEDLDDNSDPAGTDFTVNVNGSPVTINIVDVEETEVLLILATTVQPSDTVTIDYTAPASNPTQDDAGNDAASFSGQSVTNNSSDTLAPTLQSAEVNGTTLVLTYDEALDGGSDPAGTDFTVNVNGSPVTVSAVDADGSTVTLTLPTAVQPSDTVTIDYTTPASNPTQDDAGNDAASFSGQSVTNNSSDTLAPTLQSAEVNGTTLVLTYDEALDGGSDPAGTDFTVNVNGSPVTVSAVDADGSTVTLTLPTAVQPSDTVTVDYTTPASNPTQDTTGNDAASFSGQSVTNNSSDTLAPVLQSAEVTDSTLVLTYDEALDGGSDPTDTDFTVTVNGSPVTVSSVDADGTTVTLTLASAVISTDTVAIDYTPGGNPIQDAAGNAAAALSSEPVTNRDVTPPPAPELPTLDAQSDTGTSDSDRLTNDPTPEITGTDGEPGSTIELFIGDEKIGEAVVDGDGNWTISPSVDLADGTYEVTAKATDSSGNVSPFSGALPITIDTTGALGAVINLDEPIRDSGVEGIKISFNEAVLNFDISDIQLSLDGTPIDLTGATLTSPDDITWFLGNIPGFAEASGNYQIDLTAGDITDLAGNSLSETTGSEWLTGYTADIQEKPKTSGKINLRESGTGAGDSMSGSNEGDRLRGRSGDDRIRGRGGNDKLIGGGGNDKVSGGGGNDLLSGRNGNDNLLGRGGNDRIVGGGGNDTLKGGGGDDLLFGKKGNDTMVGGRGTDTFLFRKLRGDEDKIRKFQADDDFIDVRGIFKKDAFSANNRFAQFVEYIELVQVGSNTEVQIDADGSGAETDMTTLVTLINTTATDISSENFVIGQS